MGNYKVLIMVLSSMKPPYDKIYEAQRETWDSFNVDGVETFYYFGTDYEMMHHAFKLALKEVWQKDWDFIFRTNSSTYVRKDKLKDFIDTLDPKDNIYEGAMGGDMISGTGILLSRSSAKILKNKLNKKPYPSEDYKIAEILIKAGISPKESKLRRGGFHFQGGVTGDYDYIRCKSEIKNNGEWGLSDLNRNWDIIAMRNLKQRYE